MVMKGLKSWMNWRTFLVGFVVGYIVAWGMHGATTLYNTKRQPVHISLFPLTP